MDRLTTELHRLYLPQGLDTEHPVDDAGLVTPSGLTRAISIELAHPISVDTVGRFWQQLQDDWGLPAPAIAISGSDAYQLWISLDTSIPVNQAHQWTLRLVEHALSDVPNQSVRLWPNAQGTHTRLPPGLHAPNRWSAFVSPGLASLFSDERWLETPPSIDAQADLLLRLKPLSGPDLQRIAQALNKAATKATPTPHAPSELAPIGSSASTPTTDPRSFLLQVMNDPQVDIRWRIEAAKALL